MKRVLLVPILALFLVPLLLMCLSAEYALAQTPAATVTADILRGPYEAAAPGNPYGVSAPLVALTGDVSRNPYGVSVPLVALTGDGIRSERPLAAAPRTPYGVSLPLVVLTGDVTRTPYGVSIPLVALTGGGLRNPYGVLVPLVTLTGGAARGPMTALVFRRGDQPLADILRGPYEAPQAAPAVSPFAWVLAGLAMVALIVALALDFLRRKRQVAQPAAGATTVPHAH